MGIGFGPSMFFYPMVIVWPNQGSNITLSQRKASGFVMPMPDRHPQRAAVLTAGFPSFDEETFPKVSFSVPANNQTDQVLVWAFSEDRPPSADPDTDILKHSQAGAIRFSISSAGLSHPHYHGDDEDIVSTKILLVGHGVLTSFGFLVLLPMGSLVARWGRTFSGKWMVYHRAVNMVVAPPTISLGVSMAAMVVFQHDERHFVETHAITGLLLYCLYIGQILLGRCIHAHRVLEGAKFHPPQNVIHVLLGVGIIGLSIYQIHTGFSLWHRVIGTSIPSWAHSAWFVWSLLIPISYVAGLVLLPKQFNQEHKSIINALSSDEERGPMLSCGSNTVSKLKLSLMESESEVWLSPIQGTSLEPEVAVFKESR